MNALLQKTINQQSVQQLTESDKEALKSFCKVLIAIKKRTLREAVLKENDKN